MKGTPRSVSLTQGRSRTLDASGKAPGKPVGYQARSLEDWEPVPYEPAEEDEVSPFAPAYLLAQARAGISESLPRQWKRRHPDFATTLEDLKEGVRDRWNALAPRKALEGFEERRYNAEGELVGRKVREDPSFLNVVLGSLDAEKWGRAGESAQSITVNIVQVEE